MSLRVWVCLSVRFSKCSQSYHCPAQRLPNAMEPMKPHVDDDDAVVLSVCGDDSDVDDDDGGDVDDDDGDNIM